MLVFVCLSAIVFYCKSFDNIIRVVKVGQQQVKRQSINFLTFYDYQDFYRKKSVCKKLAVFDNINGENLLLGIVEANMKRK